MDIKVNIYGVRGSAPISHANYMKYGGNTASYTIRTPDNSLLFLDAGTGIKFAEKELNEETKKVFLLISHTHADHIIGFGMSKLSKLQQDNLHKNLQLQIIGPSGIKSSLAKFYDGETIWPVKFGKTNDGKWSMQGIDYDNIVEFSKNNQEIEIDSKSKIVLMQGNHPVNAGVIMYRVEMQTKKGNFKIVYATDNEFDYLPGSIENPAKNKLKSDYIKFIQSADLLIAEAQYTKENYEAKKGFGHSYPEQIIDLATQADVKKLLITHHDLITDTELEAIEIQIAKYTKNKNSNLIVEFAKEGNELKY